MRLKLRHCLGNPASLFNVLKLYQDFRSQGQSLSKDTLYIYRREHFRDLLAANFS